MEDDDSGVDDEPMDIEIQVVESIELSVREDCLWVKCGSLVCSESP